MSRTIPSKCLQIAPGGSQAWPGTDPMLSVPDELWPAIAKSCESIFVNAPWIQPEASSPISAWHLERLSELVDKARSYELEVVVGTATGGYPKWLPMKDGLPDKLGVKSPWGIFQTTVAKLLAGRARWIVPFNEPNGAAKPTGEQLAWAVRSADKTFATVPNRPGLLMPALLDLHDAIPMLVAMFKTLHDGKWDPQCEVGLCHHCYDLDIHEASAITTAAKQYEWPGRKGLWFTEEGRVERMVPVGDVIHHWQQPQVGQLADQLREKDFWMACVEYNKKLSAYDEWTINMGTHYQLTWNDRGTSNWFTALYVDTSDGAGEWKLTPFGEWWMASKRFTANTGLLARVRAFARRLTRR